MKFRLATDVTQREHAAIFRVDGIPLAEQFGDALHGLIVHVRQYRIRIGRVQ